MRQFNPPHPAAILREDILPELGISISQAAEELGVSCVLLSRLLNEKEGISPQMALRLEKWLTNPSAEVWLSMQSAYDLWQEEQKGKEFNIIPLATPKAQHHVNM